MPDDLKALSDAGSGMDDIRSRYAAQIDRYSKYYEPKGLFGAPHLTVGVQGFALEFDEDTRDDEHREWLGIMLCNALDNLVTAETAAAIEAARAEERAEIDRLRSIIVYAGIKLSDVSLGVMADHPPTAIRAGGDT